MDNNKKPKKIKQESGKSVQFKETPGKKPLQDPWDEFTPKEKQYMERRGLVALTQ